MTIKMSAIRANTDNRWILRIMANGMNTKHWARIRTCRGITTRHFEKVRMSDCKFSATKPMYAQTKPICIDEARRGEVGWDMFVSNNWRNKEFEQKLCLNTPVVLHSVHCRMRTYLGQGDAYKDSHTHLTSKKYTAHVTKSSRHSVTSFNKWQEGI